MATTLTIPLVTLPVGSRTFGPHTAADADSAVTLSIDRTVAGGLNAAPPSTVLGLAVEQSPDGGATWDGLAAVTMPGGSYTDKHGQPYAAADVTVTLGAGTGRRLRALVSVAGAPVAVQGTLATS